MHILFQALRNMILFFKYLVLTLIYAKNKYNQSIKIKYTVYYRPTYMYMSSQVIYSKIMNKYFLHAITSDVTTVMTVPWGVATFSRFAESFT